MAKVATLPEWMVIVAEEVAIHIRVERLLSSSHQKRLKKYLRKRKLTSYSKTTIGKGSICPVRAEAFPKVDHPRLILIKLGKVSLL